MIKAAIVGGSGYTGGELARIICRHPEIEVSAVTSRQLAGSSISKAHPFLQGFLDIKFQERLTGDHDVVFTATPHGASMEIVPELLASGVKVIDLSGDYRLKDPATYKHWYGHDHKDAINLEKAVYGIPELFREEIAKADFISNPGCYPTCSILSLAPMFANGLVDDRLVIDAKSSTSGAGAEPTKATHHPTCGASITPYKVGTHRHTPEIQMCLEGLYQGKLDVIFTPHLLPVVRGMLTTSYVTMRQELSIEALNRSYEEFYKGSRFVRRTNIPSMQSVVGSNFCEVGLEVAGKNTVVVMGAIDNLVKGASGQAVQNCNIMFGLEETMGLDFPGLGV